MTTQSLVLVHDAGNPALSPHHLSDIEGEARIRDLTLAERLGFTDPHMIRRLVERNEDELRGYGGISVTVTENTGRGRPGREYWLNEGQALLICMFSRTAAAAGVRKQVIDVFTAWRHAREARPKVEAPKARKEAQPITADDLADAEAILRISSVALARRLRVQGMSGLIDEHKAELICLGAIRLAGGGRSGSSRYFLLTEGQALRLCVLSGAKQAGVVCNEITEAFAEHRRLQADEARRQQQTITALVSEVTTVRAALSHFAAQTPVDDRLTAIEAAIGGLRFGKDEIKAVGRLLGLTDRQEHELAKWMAARGSNKPLTEAQKRWRRGYHARKGAGA